MSLLSDLKNQTIYILSPHFDDAILSCGSLLLHMTDLSNVTVVNVFTRAHEGPYTMSARRFLWQMGVSNPQDLFEMRAKEDAAVLNACQVQVQNVGLIDGLFRQKQKLSLLGKVLPEIDHLYPTYRWHMMRSVSSNDPASEMLTEYLVKAIPTDVIVFVPYGIGNHVDHQLVRQVGEKLFQRCILYSDFPYNQRIGQYGTVPDGYQKKEVPVDVAKKQALLQGYKTQFIRLFPEDKIPEHQEIYFIKDTLWT